MALNIMTNIKSDPELDDPSAAQFRELCDLASGFPFDSVAHEIIAILRDTLLELQIECQRINWREITEADMPGLGDEVLRFGLSMVTVVSVEAIGTKIMPEHVDEWHDHGFYWFRPLLIPSGAVLL
jgi:hypothetical protein